MLVVGVSGVGPGTGRAGPQAVGRAVVVGEAVGPGGVCFTIEGVRRVSGIGELRGHNTERS